MAQKLSRRDLKRNELADTVGKTVDYVSHHRRGAVEIIAVVAGIVVLAAGFFLVRSYRERAAGTALSAGLAALETPLASEPAAQDAPKTYPTAAERTREAETHLKKAASYGGTVAGRAAKVVLAARVEKGTDSQEVLASAAREGQAEIAAVAELDMARLLAAQGKTAEAIDRLKRAIESPEAVAPKDALLFALAEIYERAGSSEDAKATYRRLVTDYPNSPYRSEAQQRVPAS
ncbi:MAG: tetratricopeptide repeat protein [Thermoanaerobaculia bacterium]|nr:tetratricopeptide repeat protein [Thermoanaerobaculia bacterium]